MERPRPVTLAAATTDGRATAGATGRSVTDAADRLSDPLGNRPTPFRGSTRATRGGSAVPTGPTLDLAAEISAGKATLGPRGARLRHPSPRRQRRRREPDLAARPSAPVGHRETPPRTTVQLAGHRRPHRDPRGNAGSLLVCAPADLGCGSVASRRWPQPPTTGSSDRATPGRARRYATTKYHAA